MPVRKTMPVVKVDSVPAAITAAPDVKPAPAAKVQQVTLGKCPSCAYEGILSAIICPVCDSILVAKK
jgi:hypothetical protein